MKRIRNILILCQLCFFLPALQAQHLQSSTDPPLAPYFYFPTDHRVDNLPLKNVSADIKISGIIAYVELEQLYVNTGQKALEATYVFPGSTDAALHGMEMMVGQRLIEAQIEERRQARRIFEQAKADGKTTSLLEQHRPNVFEMNVAHIGPGDTVKIRIKYSEMIQFKNDSYEFVLPTVVGPRYSERNSIMASTKHRWVANPYLEEGVRSAFGYQIKMTINAGVPITQVQSPSHEVDFQFESAEVCTMNLKDESRLNGNKDFILRYKLKDEKISAGLLLHEGEDENFFALMVQPPEDLDKSNIPPREFLFVVDVSGSMSGFPSRTARDLMHNLLDDLRPEDRFNVMTFASGNRIFSPVSVPPTVNNMLSAERFLKKANGGGTRLYNALRDALEMDQEPGLSRSIVVITDGYVDFESNCFELIRNNLFRSNVYAIGIGSSVNRYLIEGMAFAGQGRDYVVTSPSAAKVKSEQFAKEIAATALSNVMIDFGNTEVYDVEPLAMPDILSTRPGIVHGKYKGEFPEFVTVRGQKDQPVEFVVHKSQNSTMATDGLPYLWARKRLKYLSDFDASRQKSKIDEITALGLKYEIMTAYTSFVAVDEEGEKSYSKLTKVRQSLPLPHGVMNSAVGTQYRRRLAATGAVSRATNAAIQLKMPSHQVELAGSHLVVDWEPMNTTTYVVQIKNIFDEVLFEKETSSGLVVNMDDVKYAEAGLYILQVRDLKNPEKRSDATAIRIIDRQDLISKGISLEIMQTQPTTLQEYLDRAAYFETYNLLMDALALYVMAYNQWQDQEAYEKMEQCLLNMGFGTN